MKSELDCVTPLAKGSKDDAVKEMNDEMLSKESEDVAVLIGLENAFERKRRECIDHPFQVYCCRLYC